MAKIDQNQELKDALKMAQETVTRLDNQLQTARMDFADAVRDARAAKAENDKLRHELADSQEQTESLRMDLARASGGSTPSRARSR